MTQFKNHYLTPEQLSEMIGISVNTLRKWRWEGKGPKFVKFGSRVSYRQCDVEQFVESNLFSSTTECEEVNNERL